MSEFALIARAGRPFLLAALSTLAVALPAEAQVLPRSTFGPDGETTAMARSGDTLFVGGVFAHLGLTTGGLGRFDASTAQVSMTFPHVDGEVWTIASDGSGGYYIGGYFTKVYGVPRSNAARILANGTVGAWDPQADLPVRAIVSSGTRVFLAGQFHTLRGRTRSRVAGVDPVTGIIADSIGKTAQPNNVVYDLHLANGALIVGGIFSSITVGGAGNTRRGLASISTTDGSLQTWNTTLPSGSQVYAIEPHGGSVIIGGNFTWKPDAQTRNDVAEVALATGAATVWAPSGSNGEVDDLLIDGNTLYCGGTFTTINGISRPYCAALDATSGALLQSFAPLPLQPGSVAVGALGISGGRLLIGGSFAIAGDSIRSNIAAVDGVTGAPQAWNPNPDGAVYHILVDGPNVVLGGAFNQVSRVDRIGLGAIDLASGRPLPWRRDVAGLILSMQVGPAEVYVGGQYDLASGGSTCLAAFNRNTGAILGWNPQCNGPVYSLLLRPDRLYVGGAFTGIGGATRACLAAVNLTSGTALPWNPFAYGDVRTIQGNGATVYVGGSFAGIGFPDGHGGYTNIPRGLAAEIDTAGVGALRPWNPQITQTGSDRVLAIARQPNGNVALGGTFSSVANQPRRCLAVVNAQNGALDQTILTMPTAAEAATILSLAFSGPLLYVGGQFTTWTDGIQSNIARTNLAVLDIRNGSLREWAPDPNNIVWQVAADPERLLAVGKFGRFVGERCFALADIGVLGVTPLVTGAPNNPPGPQVRLRQSYPNPARQSANIAFDLPSEGEVSLDVFDVQGRLVSSPIRPVRMLSGTHTVHLSTARWAPGVYLCRLRVGSQSQTRAMVVIE